MTDGNGGCIDDLLIIRREPPSLRTSPLFLLLKKTGEKEGAFITRRGREVNTKKTSVPPLPPSFYFPLSNPHPSPQLQFFSYEHTHKARECGIKGTHEVSGMKNPISQEHTELCVPVEKKSGCLARKKKEGEELDMKVLGWEGMR